MLIIGCDIHTRYQQTAMVDSLQQLQPLITT
jgi:hypothetical protein